MQDAFLVIIVVVVAVGAVAGVWAMAGADEALRRLGTGGLSLRDGTDRPLVPMPSGAVAAREREAEIRQMLEARNARRTARGLAPQDVEAELAALLRPAADPGLELEVRQHVIARNARRLAAGKPPLDVDAEVTRQLRDLR